MIVVKIELHSAITGEVTPLGRMNIWNRGDSGDRRYGNYGVAVKRKDHVVPKQGERAEQYAARTGEVLDYPRLSYNIWRLISRAIRSAFPEEN